MHIYIYIHIHIMYTHLAIYLSIYLSVCLSIYLSSDLSIDLSIYPFIYINLILVATMLYGTFSIPHEESRLKERVCSSSDEDAQESRHPTAMGAGGPTFCRCYYQDACLNNCYCEAVGNSREQETTKMTV